MQLTDLNHARDIGSNCLLLEIGAFRIMFDCGMHPKKVGNGSVPQLSRLEDDSLDLIIITHSHLDHIGGLPVALRYQRDAPVLVSPPTKILLPRMLRNSCGVMLRQRDELNLPELPLFTYGEVERLEGRLQAVPFNKPRVFEKDGDKLEITFFPAGHVAGAAGVRFVHGKRRYFFTGDVLFSDQCTLVGARFPKEPFDVVVTETTRGARSRPPNTTRDGENVRLIEAINQTLLGGGTVLVPAFALGRLQEVLALIHEARRNNKLVESLIFVSGLGLDLVDYFDMITRQNPTVRFRRRILDELHVHPMRQKLTPGREPGQRGIYVLSSGMMVEHTPSFSLAASIVAHPRNAIFFAGYCDPETPGGKLLAAKPEDKFKFDGLDYIGPVRARVERFDLSGHADREELRDYTLARQPKTIVITHGDPGAREWFTGEFSKAKHAPKVIDPMPGEPYQI